jgi:hypothetical protein
MILNSDAPEYGGHGRLVAGQEHLTSFDIVANRQSHLLSLYLPTRTTLILQRLNQAFAVTGEPFKFSPA